MNHDDQELDNDQEAPVEDFRTDAIAVALAVFVAVVGMGILFNFFTR